MCNVKLSRAYIYCFLVIASLGSGPAGGASKTVSAGVPDVTVLNDQTLAQEQVLAARSKGSCKYAVVSGKVRVARGEVSTAEKLNSEIACDDVSDSSVEIWLNMLENYEKLYSALQTHQEHMSLGTSLITQFTYRVAKAYACASLRFGFELGSASLRAIDLAESYGQKSGDNVIVQWVQDLREILSSPLEEKEIPPPCVKRGYFTAIPDATWQQMQGRSWHAGRRCPTRDSLAFARIPFVDFDGKSRVGEMIIAKSVAPMVLDAFSEIYASGFRIESMDLIDKYDGNDARSMAANNSSAFNCRAMTSGTGTSEHSTGRAIDLNPRQNPYVTPRRVEPQSMYSKLSQRTENSVGLIQKDGAVVRAFAKVGWKWGGSWNHIKDYQHFSETGR